MIHYFLCEKLFLQLFLLEYPRGVKQCMQIEIVKIFTKFVAYDPDHGTFGLTN